MTDLLITFYWRGVRSSYFTTSQISTSRYSQIPWSTPSHHPRPPYGDKYYSRTPKNYKFQPKKYQKIEKHISDLSNPSRDARYDVCPVSDMLLSSVLFRITPLRRVHVLHRCRPRCRPTSADVPKKSKLGKTNCRIGFTITFITNLPSTNLWRCLGQKTEKPREWSELAL